MFDFNGDGKNDTGEHFIGYEIYEDVTGNTGNRFPRQTNKTDGFTIFIIAIIVWQVLSIIASALY